MALVGDIETDSPYTTRDNLNADARRRGTEALIAKKRSNPNNRKAHAFICSLIKEGLNYSQIAVQLNQNGFGSPEVDIVICDLRY